MRAFIFLLTHDIWFLLLIIVLTIGYLDAIIRSIISSTNNKNSYNHYNNNDTDDDDSACNAWGNINNYGDADVSNALDFGDDDDDD
ncbi:MAG: hypothetical protein ACYCSW_11555 [bacterium]|jgi:hypothetical protein